MDKKGQFVISLDFELIWGVRDNSNLAGYLSNLRGTKAAVYSLIDLFKEFDIHVSVATVGFLFAQSEDELKDYIPKLKPTYLDDNYSPYLTEGVKNDLNIKEEELFFSIDLINKFLEAGHEIATHTFSHYYCLEEGQKIEQFEADLVAAISIAKKNNIDIKSIVFPRNQCNSSYLRVCEKLGITSYRGVENSRYYSAVNKKGNSLVKRFVRLIDSYVNITGYHIYQKNQMDQKGIVNIPSSRFLRPFSKRFKLLEPLRLRRIIKGIEKAADQGMLYHLWWHPHNFGNCLEENLNFLKKVLKRVDQLKKSGKIEVLTMAEYSKLLKL